MFVSQSYIPNTGIEVTLKLYMSIGLCVAMYLPTVVPNFEPFDTKRGVLALRLDVRGELSCGKAERYLQREGKLLCN